MTIQRIKIIGDTRYRALGIGEYIVRGDLQKTKQNVYMSVYTNLVGKLYAIKDPDEYQTIWRPMSGEMSKVGGETVRIYEVDTNPTSNDVTDMREITKPNPLVTNLLPPKREANKKYIGLRCVTIK